jgi:hypothetical protein
LTIDQSTISNICLSAWLMGCASIGLQRTLRTGFFKKAVASGMAENLT